MSLCLLYRSVLLARVLTLHAILTVGCVAAKAQNLVVNGDFEAGNSGFTSGHAYRPRDAVSEGTYDVNTSPRKSHRYISLDFGDHTTGRGLMLLVNVSPVLDRLIWRQTVAVRSNRTYFFSGWGSSWAQGGDVAPPRISVSINGSFVLPRFDFGRRAPEWSSFSAQWSSGDATNATIEIRSLRTERLGNDLALDDLSLYLLGESGPEAAIYTAVEIAWPASLGKYFQVQWTTNALGEGWRNLGLPIQGNGQTGSILDTTRATPRRFYRVLSLE